MRDYRSGVRHCELLHGLIVMSCGLVVAISSGPCGRVRVARLMRWWSSTGRRRRDAADRRVFLFLVLRN